MQVWGVQNDHPDLDLIGNGHVSLGWDEVGELSASRCRQGGSKGVSRGGLVIYAYKPDCTLAFWGFISRLG